jgi:hypothetical protein
MSSAPVFLQVFRTYEVTPCSNMGEDSRSLSLIVISTETIDQVMVIKHVDPYGQSSTHALSMITHIGIEELARPKALLRKILQ